MKVYFATDHAGLELKAKLIEFVKSLGHDAIDKGAFTFDPADDYPDFISLAAKEVSNDPQSRAVIIGGSGQGEAIVANRFPNVRAAVFYTPAIAKIAVDAEGRMSTDPYEIVRLARLHNDINVLSVSGRFLSEQDTMEAVKVFLTTDFSGVERHTRRIKKIDQYSS